MSETATFGAEALALIDPKIMRPKTINPKIMRPIPYV